MAEKLMGRLELRDAMQSNSLITFSVLRDFCFRLNIDYESVQGNDDRKVKILELILYCERHIKYPELVAVYENFLRNNNG